MALSIPQSEGKWIIYSFLVMLLVLLLLVLRWPLLPNFIDIYYHLLSAQGFLKAGGYLTHDFWSWAPVGRPHLYPPVFHCLLLFLLKAGILPLTIARLCDASVFLLLLLTLMWCMRSLFSARAAFFCVLIATSLYSFYLSSSNFMPVTIACIFGLLSVCVAQRGKRIAAVLLLSLAFYTHAQMPWFFVVVYLTYAALNRSALPRCLQIIGGALIIALPYLAFLFINRRFFHAELAHERFVIEVNLSLLLGLFALPHALREKGRGRAEARTGPSDWARYRLLVALALAAVPFAFSYPYRYVSGQGLIGWVMLSACALERLSCLPQRRLRRTVVTVMLLCVLVSPSLLITPKHRVSLSFYNSTYRNLVFGHGQLRRTNEYSISSSRFMKDLVSIISASSEPGDILYANLNLAGTVLAALSQRYDAQGMLNEVVPYRRDDPMSRARLIVWFKDPRYSAEARTGPFSQARYSAEARTGPSSQARYSAEALPSDTLERMISTLSLQLVRETQIAHVFRNPSAVPVKDIPSPLIGFPWVCLIGLAFTGALAFALLKERDSVPVS